MLALLRGERRYGIEIVELLGGIDGLATSEGTLYPLLSRLRRERSVSTSWQESAVGPPRRYYELTASGRRALNAFAEEWARYRDAVDSLLGAEDRSTS